MERQLRQLGSTGSFDDLSPGEMLAQLQLLGMAAAPEDQVRAYQAVRLSGNVPDDLCWFCIAHALMSMADDRLDHFSSPELDKIQAYMKIVEEEHDAPFEEGWIIGEGPPEWEALNAESDRIYDAFHAAVMREYAEDEMADLYTSNRVEFAARYERLRRSSFGPPPGDQN